MKLTWQQIGLSAFVFTTATIVVVLFYDLHLRLTGQEMITDYCRANPWLAWAILAFIEFGVLGLAVHFMAQIPVD